jgi:hypothetical protein
MTIRNIYVWGCSDDLIEITGDIEEEFSGDGHGDLVICSDGTVLEVVYDSEGNWRFLINELGKDASVVTHKPGSEEAQKFSKGRDYTEVAEVQGYIEWLVVTQKIARPKK